MYSSTHAAAGYQRSAQSVGTSHAVEYQAFQRVNAALRKASKDGAPIAATADAIHMNNRLWSVLAADLMDDGNVLPEGLRAQLLSLAVFSVKHGEKVLAGQETVETLIDINGSIMGGLNAASKNQAA